MRVAVYPGSFDPITNGHIDVLERSSKIFDRIIIAVVHNVTKKAMFTLDERVDMIRQSAAHIPNVEISCFSGLLANYLIEKQACAIIRGLRTVTDFEYEMHMAMINREIIPEIDTIFVTSDKNYIFISSSGVKEASMVGANVANLVPPVVNQALKQKYQASISLTT
ncbi:phosphopantetheine adenylyltransferase [hydrocarbon metagenome]|uniref:Phosphopantetheine adenylyltransferase n=1 Tax=hydrocarbon metagenome TaxID=938273 RepID=A0A0W8E794_9ZZZZ